MHQESPGRCLKCSLLGLRVSDSGILRQDPRTCISYINSQVTPQPTLRTMCSELSPRQTFPFAQSPLHPPSYTVTANPHLRSRLPGATLSDGPAHYGDSLVLQHNVSPINRWLKSQAGLLPKIACTVPGPSSPQSRQRR